MGWFKAKTKPRYFVAPVTGGYLACFRSLRYAGGFGAVSVTIITCLDGKGLGVCSPTDAPLFPRVYHYSRAAAEASIALHVELRQVGA